MLNRSDAYCYHEVVPITFGTITATLEVTYEVRRYVDIRNLGCAPSYRVVCTQRVRVPAALFMAGEVGVGKYDAYPALVVASVNLQGAGKQPAGELISYTPRTLNAAVTSSLSDNTGTSANASMQNTSGASTSQSNTFSTSVSLGFFGEDETGDFSASESKTYGGESSSSVSSGQDSGSQRGSGSGTSMSVKDWACYSQVGAGAEPSVSWTWGQQYPWDVIRFAPVGGVLPNFVSQNLVVQDDGSAYLLPPSQLSMFGLDFTMMSLWLVPSADDLVTFAHSVQYCTATHQLNGSAVSASVDASVKPVAWSSQPLDLALYGLDPLLADGGPAIIGFVPRQFSVLPQPSSGGQQPTKLKISSMANNLLVLDTTSYAALDAGDDNAGFSSTQTALLATFTPNCQSLTLSLSFKVVDSVTAYQLFFKHWKTTAAGVSLQVIVNGDEGNMVTLYCDAMEAEGGESNVSSIMLRNLNYGSVDYHDYLTPGINQIEVTLQPMPGGSDDCGYALRALSVEQS